MSDQSHRAIQPRTPISSPSRHQGQAPNPAVEQARVAEEDPTSTHASSSTTPPSQFVVPTPRSRHHTTPRRRAEASLGSGGSAGGSGANSHTGRRRVRRRAQREGDADSGVGPIRSTPRRRREGVESMPTTTGTRGRRDDAEVDRNPFDVTGISNPIPRTHRSRDNGRRRHSHRRRGHSIEEEENDENVSVPSSSPSRPLADNTVEDVPVPEPVLLPVVGVDPDVDLASRIQARSAARVLADITAPPPPPNLPTITNVTVPPPSPQRRRVHVANMGPPVARVLFPSAY